MMLNNNIKNYLITFAFVGILLDNKPFINLYVKLNDYLRDNGLSDDIIMQDIHSIHLTLYYLTKDVVNSKKNIVLMRKIDKSLNSIKLNITSLNYFYLNGNEKACYLEPNNIEKLTKLNKLLSDNLSKYSGEDNDFKFSPHVTLFKIKNSTSFNKKHKNNLEKIINKNLMQVKKINLHLATDIFLANSTIEPELQIPINLLF